MKPLDEQRPWGSFRQLTHNEPTTVKLLFIKDGERLSLQRHRARSEFMRVISGTPEVQIGETITLAKPGDEFTIPAGIPHRVSAKGGDASYLEISHGEFDEHDEERLEDDYGRT